MSDLYGKQEDGALKPIEHPEQLVKRPSIYKWLRSERLGLNEI